MCQLPIRGVTAEAVKEAVALGKSSNIPMSVMMHELKVAYELLLDAKRHKQRIADVVLAAQDCSRTPPAAGTSPKILGGSFYFIYFYSDELLVIVPRMMMFCHVLLRTWCQYMYCIIL